MTTAKTARMKTKPEPKKSRIDSCALHVPAPPQCTHAPQVDSCPWCIVARQRAEILELKVQLEMRDKESGP